MTDFIPTSTRGVALGRLCTLAAIALLGACAPSAGDGVATSAAPTEASGHAHTADEATAGTPDSVPQRIISLGGAVTETVFALGMGANVVGVDATSSYPADTADLPNVGYYRALPAEGIVALTPDLILADASAGPPAVLEAIEASGTPVHRLTDAWGLEATQERIRDIGERLGRAQQAQALAEQVAADVEQARSRIAAGDAPRVLFIYARGGRTQLMAGTNTAAHAMIELAGATNALQNVDGFRPITAEAVASSDADVILLPEASLEGLGGLDGLRELPGMAQNAALAAGAVVTMDDGLLLSFGPRLGLATETLVELLNPYRGQNGAAPEVVQ